MAAGHSRQFTPMRLPVNTVIHTTLVGLEPATFRSLVRRATSSATEHVGGNLCNRLTVVASFATVVGHHQDFVNFHYVAPVGVSFSALWLLWPCPCECHLYVYEFVTCVLV